MSGVINWHSFCGATTFWIHAPILLGCQFLSIMRRNESQRLWLNDVWPGTTLCRHLSAQSVCEVRTSSSMSLPSVRTLAAQLRFLSTPCRHEGKLTYCYFTCLLMVFPTSGPLVEDYHWYDGSFVAVRLERNPNNIKTVEQIVRAESIPTFTFKSRPSMLTSTVQLQFWSNQSRYKSKFSDCFKGQFSALFPGFYLLSWTGSDKKLHRHFYNLIRKVLALVKTSSSFMANFWDFIIPFLSFFPVLPFFRSYWPDFWKKFLHSDFFRLFEHSSEIKSGFACFCVKKADQVTRYVWQFFQVSWSRLILRFFLNFCAQVFPYKGQELERPESSWKHYLKL